MGEVGFEKGEEGCECEGAGVDVELHLFFFFFFARFGWCW